jgi:hypothetical protein
MPGVSFVNQRIKDKNSFAEKHNEGNKKQNSFELHRLQGFLFYNYGYCKEE